MCVCMFLHACGHIQVRIDVIGHVEAKSVGKFDLIHRDKVSQSTPELAGMVSLGSQLAPRNPYL